MLKSQNESEVSTASALLAVDECDAKHRGRAHSPPDMPPLGKGKAHALNQAVPMKGTSTPAVPPFLGRLA